MTLPKWLERERNELIDAHEMFKYELPGHLDGFHRGVKFCAYRYMKREKIAVEALDNIASTIYDPTGLEAAEIAKETLNRLEDKEPIE